MRRPFLRAALLLTLLLLLCPAALCEAAAQDIDVTAHAMPGSMVLAQDVRFSFLLENTGSNLMTDVAVLFPEANGQHPVGNIPAGESASAQFTYPVTDADLAAGSITFSVAYTDSADAASAEMDVIVPVTREAERPEVEFTRQLSSRYVHAGDEVTLVYQVKNTGNVTLTDLALSDPLGEFTGSHEQLAVGETHTFISRVPMTESAASTPTLRFSSGASGQSYTKSLSSAPVTLAEEAIYAQLHVDRTQVEYGEVVTLTLTLTNGGNVSFTDITLTDNVLGMMVNAPLSLPSGAAPMTIARSCVIKSDTTFCVQASGQTDAGRTFSVKTDPVSVSVIRSEGTADLTLSAEPSAQILSEPGMVAFTLTLSNNGQNDLARVTLREAERGEIRVFDIVPAGAPTVREQLYEVTENATFRFIAEITDSDGDVRIVSSEPVDITISEDGASPIAAQTSSISGLLHSNAIRVGGISLYPVMIAGALLLLALLVMAFVISGRRKRRQRDINRAERQKRSELLGRTNKFKPIGRRRNKEGKN